MKNKIAERAKKKRRAAKEADKQKERDEILSKFAKVAKEKGVKKYNKKNVWNSFLQMDRDLTAKAIVYSVIVVAYCLHKNYGWGTERLSQYVNGTHKYLITVGNNNRSIPKLKDELIQDAGLDWDSIFGDYTPYNESEKSEDPRHDEGKVMAQKMTYLLPMVMYTLYFDKGWKKKRMNRIGQQIREILVEVIEHNKISQLKKTLLEECKMRFNDDGTVYINE